MRRAVFSPDGTKRAYSRGRRVANLWRVPILEDRPATWADAQQLTFDEAYIERVDLSPDAERLLVQSDRSGNMDLWVLPRDGGEWMQVTSEPTPDWYLRWSPNGQDIAFFSYRTGNREIWVMPVSGGPAHQLTDGQATNTESWLPAWSPDGREIAFSSSPAALDLRHAERRRESPAGDQASGAGFFSRLVAGRGMARLHSCEPSVASARRRRQSRALDRGAVGSGTAVVEGWEAGLLRRSWNEWEPLGGVARRWNGTGHHGAGRTTGESEYLPCHRWPIPLFCLAGRPRRIWVMDVVTEDRGEQ